MAEMSLIAVNYLTNLNNFHSLEVVDQRGSTSSDGKLQLS